MSYALVIIDMQCGLFETDPAPFEADTVVRRINALAHKARTDGMPVVFVRHQTGAGALVHGSPGWQLLPGLDVRDSDLLIGKSTPDSFLRTELDATLKEHGISELLVCGYASEFCVDTTVRSAAAHGYAVTLAADAHTTHDKEHLPASTIREHENRTLPDITSFGVRIRALPVTDILAMNG